LGASTIATSDGRPDAAQPVHLALGTLGPGRSGRSPPTLGSFPFPGGPGSCPKR
jgi:hypothetical protein